MALAVAAYAAATLWASERYPGLLLGIGLIASHKLAWFITIAFGAATLIVSVDYVVTQMGILMTGARAPETATGIVSR